MAAGGVHEELQRVERARDRRGCDRARLLGRLVAHDHVALFERGAETGEVVLAQLMLVRQRLNVLLLDEAALGGLLEQALGRRQVMQVNRVAQLNPFRFGGWGRPGRTASLGRAARSWSTARRPFPLADL